jgi:hypothetical protein
MPRVHLTITVLCLLHSAAEAQDSGAVPPYDRRGTDQPAALAGLGILRRDGSTANREVRVWVGGGVAVPDVALILRVGPDTSGQFLVYWDYRVVGDSALRSVITANFHCGHAVRETGATGICLPQPRGNVDWPSAARELDSLEVYTMPDESTFPRHGVVSNQPGVTVEIWQAGEYHDFGFQGWRYPKDIAERATGVRRLFDRLLSTYMGRE